MTTLTLLAPLSGVIVPLDAVPDPVFAQRLAGDGVSIDPLSDRVLAPCDARVLQVHRAGHALTLSAADLEIIIHVGLDTVKLKGEGFTALVKAGDQVRTGDPLITFDADLVARRSKSLLTQVVVASMERVSAIEPRSGKVVAGRDTLMRVVLGNAPPPVPGVGFQGAITSKPTVVSGESGLHARPAALLATTARRFSSDIRLVRDGREANIRSVVSILALEVAGGQTVTIVARGDDAADAVETIVDMLENGLARLESSDATELRTTSERSSSVARADDGNGELRGVPAAPGVAVGQLFHLRHDDTVSEERASDPHVERRLLETAIAAAHVQLEALQLRLTQEFDSDKAAIFAAHQELLEDPEVLDRAAAEIRAGATAAWAWQQAFRTQADRLVGLRNELIAARAVDLRDVGRRVLHLLAGREVGVTELPPDSIVLAEDLTPSDVASMDRSRVLGICNTMGSASSHVAIIARGLGIPSVAGIDPRALDIPSGTRVLIDGDAGVLKLSPTQAEEEHVARRRKADTRRRNEQLAVASQPAVTRDGHRVEIVANIGDVDEARRVVGAGGEGVGLLRSELLFMERRTAPDEDEQATIYETIAKSLGRERILVIRTLDVGGDKPLPWLPVAAEANPFLGERGVRLTLNRPEVFRTQIRAILRASQSGKVAIMFPMVSTLAEWQAAREMAEEERIALGVSAIQVGIMIETPAAALIADRFARDADFFSIGSNDLTQYTLAMDRGNPRLAPQVDALHPSVLRLIERTIAGARAHKRWVGVCGGLAGDLAAVPVLLGLGINELSADLAVLPAVKARVRTLSLEDCRTTAQAALDANDGAEVRAIVAARHP